MAARRGRGYGSGVASSDAPSTGWTEIIGVYHADGGAVGEVRYVLGKLLGTAHCSLCDITHSPVRRKPEWDRMVARLGIPVTLVHLNEQAADVRGATAVTGSPVVLGRTSEGTLVPLLTPDRLDGLVGSVGDFEAALRAALAQPAARSTPTQRGGAEPQADDCGSDRQHDGVVGEQT